MDTPAKSPFHGLTYPPERTPSTAAIGPLARDLVSLYGVPGPNALAAAVLLDQGRAQEAFELLDAAAAEIDAQTERKRSAKRGQA
jgi:hypothetical protein